MHASGSSPSILYGLRKIHKKYFATKFQFRPIFGAYKAFSFKPVKYHVLVFNPVTTNEHTVDDTYPFMIEQLLFLTNKNMQRLLLTYKI